MKLIDDRSATDGKDFSPSIIWQDDQGMYWWFIQQWGFIEVVCHTHLFLTDPALGLRRPCVGQPGDPSFGTLPLAAWPSCCQTPEGALLELLL